MKRNEYKCMLFAHFTFILYSPLKVSFFSEFHKFVRGRFSEEPEDKKQNIISNIILVNVIFIFSCKSPLSSYLLSGGHQFGGSLFESREPWPETVH